jgi:hypothetical protein
LTRPSQFWPPARRPNQIYESNQYHARIVSAVVDLRAIALAIGRREILAVRVCLYRRGTGVESGRATELGDHRFDDILTDYSHALRDRILAAQKQFKIEASALDPAQLSQTNNVDFRILKDSIDNRIFDLEELKDADWNPLVYNQSLANSLYLLVARDFDSPEKRIPNLMARPHRDGDRTNPGRD